MYTYPGNIHVHSTYSDGTGTVPQIAEAAREAGLKYVIITDHQDLQALREEGFYGEVLVIAGTELHREANHYLALDIEQNVEEDTFNPQLAIDNVNQKGGFGFLAHPFEKGSPFITNGSAFPWNNLEVDGYTGIEIWNYSSRWKSLSQSRLKMLYWYFFQRDAPLYGGPSVESLQLWDKKTRERPVVAIGGSDAHAIPFKIFCFNTVIFPYRYLFETVNTYVMLNRSWDEDENAGEMKRRVLDALKEGRCYISLDTVHPGKGFYYGAFNQEEEVPMGSELRYDGSTYLRIEVPGGEGIVRIVKDGETVHTRREKKLFFRVLQPGVYRVEVYRRRKFRRKPLPWIYSNPVYVRGQE